MKLSLRNAGPCPSQVGETSAIHLPHDGCVKWNLRESGDRAGCEQGGIATRLRNVMVRHVQIIRGTHSCALAWDNASHVERTQEHDPKI